MKNRDSSSGNLIARATAAAAAVALALAAGSARADERQDLEVLRQTTVNLIDALVEQGVLTRAKADQLIREAEAKAKSAAASRTPSTGAAVAGAAAGTAAAAAPGTVRVPYVPEVVKEEIREQIKQEVLAQAAQERWAAPNTLPRWLDSIGFDGDLRFRWQENLYPDGNTPVAFWQSQAIGPATNVDLQNTSEDYQRLLLRMRLGVNVKFNDWASGGIRITTGNVTNPVSTNQALNSNFNKLSLVLDRAFFKLDPAPWATVWAGRLPNPFFSTSELVWDEDLNFDGAAATLRPLYGPQATMRPYLTVGAFPLQVFENTGFDRWLFGGQAGFDWQVNAAHQIRFGVALYDYSNIEGVPEAPNSLGASNFGQTAYPRGFRQKGNTLFEIFDPLNPPPVTTQATNRTWGLASKFRQLQLSGQWILSNMDPYQVIVGADYVKNLGYDQQDIASRTGGVVDLTPRDTGYQMQLQFGVPRVAAAHQWNVFGNYRYLERDAALDAFTDSDFYLGGTNAKGYTLGGRYGLGRNIWLQARWLSGDRIDGPPLKIDVLQVDLNGSF